MADLLTRIEKAVRKAAPGLFLKIREFNTTRNSYEEWLNWELFLALRKARLSVDARPRLEGKRFKMFADLRISDGKDSAIVEVKIAHSATQDKYIEAIKKDGDALTALTDAQLIRIQLLFLSSNQASIRESENWKAWLGRIKNWNEAKELYYASRKPEKGSDGVYLLDRTRRQKKTAS
ncbi:MAG: hypothetical protein ACLGHJ_08420 [Gammaproteobacteria bacterium]